MSAPAAFGTRPFLTEGAFGAYPIVARAAHVAQLVRWGVKTVQLRVKDLDGPALSTEMSTAVHAVRGTDVQLVINDAWALALEHGAARAAADGATFVHLGQTDLPCADLPALRAAGIGLGVSTHSPEELAVGLAADPDYVALGPVYPTTTKQMPWAPQGLDHVAQWRDAVSPRPLVAIGGLTLERAPAVWAAGAHVCSFITDIQDERGELVEARVRAWVEAAAGR